MTYRCLKALFTAGSRKKPMAKINPCPTPVRRVGGAATACTAGHIAEDWCYRFDGETAGVMRAGKYEYDLDGLCNRTNEQWFGDDGLLIDRANVLVIDLLCGDATGCCPGGGTVGSSTFLGLTDTPGSYAGAAGQSVVVNAAGTGLEFVPNASLATVALTPPATPFVGQFWHNSAISQTFIWRGASWIAV